MLALGAEHWLWSLTYLYISWATRFYETTQVTNKISWSWIYKMGYQVSIYILLHYEHGVGCRIPFLPPLYMHAVPLAHQQIFDGATISTFCAEELCIWCQLLGRAGQWVATVSCSIVIMGTVCLWGATDTKNRNLYWICPALPYKHNCMYAASFIHRTGTRTLHYDCSAQYMLLLIRLSSMADDCRAVGCKLKDRGLFCCLPSLGFLYFLNPWFSGALRRCDTDNTRPSVALLDGDHVLHW